MATLTQRVLTPAPVRAGSQILNFDKTLVMGVINLTPDSFSGDGIGDDVGAAVALAEAMVSQGADILDLGGESTRPNSVAVDEETERSRVLPALGAIAGSVSVPISIDTKRSHVAEAAIAAGATIVNDIWGLRGDENMSRVVANHDVAIVAMHNQLGTKYSNLGAEVEAALTQSLDIAAGAGIERERVILDPGFGFGKTPAQNIELIGLLSTLAQLGRPLLFGASRKSTTGLILGGLPPEDRVEGSIALAVLATAQGANIIRTHDVGPTVRALRVSDAVVHGMPEELRDADAPGPTG
jgi:dihydropteroate synthase